MSSSIGSQDLNKIRLLGRELDIFVRKATKLNKKHHEESIFKYILTSPKDYFEDYGLKENDWTGLTEKFLEDIFGSGFLTSLEDTDCTFSLSVSF